MRTIKDCIKELKQQAADNLGAKFAIHVSDLKAGLATANKLMSESESEFKAAAAGMSKSINELKQKYQSHVKTKYKQKWF